MPDGVTQATFDLYGAQGGYFLNNLAGTALGSPSGLAVLALLLIIIGGLVWQRRRQRNR